MSLQENISLKTRHTFHMDVRTRFWADFESVEELRNILSDQALAHLPKQAIGGGSNLLFTKDYPGILLHSALKDLTVSDQADGSVLVRVGSGMIWDDLVAYCVENGWSGIENLSGIPGEVGACPVQNIGAYGVEAKDCIESVKVLDIDSLEVRNFSNLDCCFGYRDSIFKKELKNSFIVLYVTFRLSKTLTPIINYGNIKDKVDVLGGINLQNIRRAILEIRTSKLPDTKEMGNAGSFFMNPELKKKQFQVLIEKWPEIPHWILENDRVKISAAWCIEKTGWKGRKIGDAAVHDKQALVLVNLGNAKAEDVINLSEQIVQAVKERFEITLQPEVILL